MESGDLVFIVRTFCFAILYFLVVRYLFVYLFIYLFYVKSVVTKSNITVELSASPCFLGWKFSQKQLSCQVLCGFWNVSRKTLGQYLKIDHKYLFNILSNLLFTRSAII
jgi:hypothetical protein